VLKSLSSSWLPTPFWAFVALGFDAGTVSTVFPIRVTFPWAMVEKTGGEKGETMAESQQSSNRCREWTKQSRRRKRPSVRAEDGRFQVNGNHLMRPSVCRRDPGTGTSGVG
jgi:hypothetical protein